MKISSEPENLTFSHSGPHHLAEAKYDPATGKVDAGMIQSFSDNCAASLQIVDGKTTGTFLHTGDTHKTRIDMESDGTFTGAFEDTKKGLKIEIEGGVAKVVAGQIPVDGINIVGDHHVVSLKLDKENRLCGSIESKDTKYGDFKMDLDGGAVSGSLTHKGDGHDETFQISSDGTYKASVSTGPQDSKLEFSVEKGEAGVRAVGGLKLKF